MVHLTMEYHFQVSDLCLLPPLAGTILILFGFGILTEIITLMILKTVTLKSYKNICIFNNNNNNNNLVW